MGLGFYHGNQTTAGVAGQTEFWVPSSSSVKTDNNYIAPPIRSNFSEDRHRFKPSHLKMAAMQNQRSPSMNGSSFSVGNHSNSGSQVGFFNIRNEIKQQLH